MFQNMYRNVFLSMLFKIYGVPYIQTQKITLIIQIPRIVIEDWIIFFVSQGGINNCISCKIDNIMISDHASVVCTMTPKENTLQHRIWRMNRKYLMDMEFVAYVKEQINIFILTNVQQPHPQDKPNICIIWDSFKAYIRGGNDSLCSKKES